MELVTQLYNSEGIDKSKFVGFPRKPHVSECRFCGEVVDMSRLDIRKRDELYGTLSS